MVPSTTFILNLHSLSHAHSGKPFDIKLIDFGMAHHLVDGATHVMSTKSYGTKIFLAPESYCETVDGERMYSTQTDTWQCGTSSFSCSLTP